jgi:hypothetical protein
MAFTPVSPNQQLKPLNPSMDSYMGAAKTPKEVGGIGSNPEALQSLLTMGVLSGNLSPSAGTFLQKSYLPPAETATTLRKKKEAEQSQKRAYEKINRLSKEALEIVNKKNKFGGQKNVSGFSIPQLLQENDINPFGILNLIPGWGLNEDRAELSAKLAQLSGVTAFDEAGKALTASELGIVGGKVPKIGKGEGTNRIILEQLLKDSESKYKEFMSSVGATPQMGSQGSQNDDPLGLFQ